MKKILIINCHPNPDSFNHALAASYKKGIVDGTAELRELNICELQFEPSLRYGYQRRMELEPDLIRAQEWITWADHLVWIHPVWWGGLPAVSKGFIDRTFLPGFAFKYRDNSVWWDKLLKGKTARILTTLDQPGWYYRFAFGRPSVNQLRKSTLEFCGVKPVKVTYFGPIRNSKPESRYKLLQRAEALGKADAK